MKTLKKTGAIAFIILLCLLLFQLGCDENGGGGGEDDTTTTTITNEGGDDQTTTTIGGNFPSSCLPCNELVLACQQNCDIKGCPVCLEFDTQTNGVKMVFEDGSYYIADENGMTFYDSSGNGSPSKKMSYSRKKSSSVSGQ